MTAALLAALAVSASPVAHAAPPPRVFDEATLGALLGQIQDLNRALQQGLDESTGELLLRLPALWQELKVLEEQLQRKLPMLRDQLQAIERSLREWEAPARPAAPAGRLIAV